MTTQRPQAQTTYRTALEDIEISADVETAIAQMQALPTVLAPIVRIRKEELS